MILPGEIVHCNLTFNTSKGKRIFVKEVVFSRPYSGDFQLEYKIDSVEDAHVLRRFKITEDVGLVKLEIIKSLGFKADGSEYETVKKSETDERQKNGTFI